MKFQIISDLHLEYYYTLPKIETIFIKTAPNIILAGDICYFKHPNFLKFFKIVASMFENIFFIPGNHEYYAHYEIPDNSYDEIDLIMSDKLKKYKNIHFLQKNFIEFKNFIIGGTTLWCKTDKDPINNPNSKMLNNENFMIFKNKYIPIISKIKKINKEQTDWLNVFINTSSIKNKTLIIITHYLPSIKCINDKFKNNSSNEFYYTPCDHLFQYVDYWIAGHTHEKISFKDQNCHIIINPVGTPDEDNIYDKKLVINI